jgi:hypothetical protein
MATLTITVPDEHVDRVKAAFAVLARKEVADTTAADVEAVLAEYVRNITRSYEEDVANLAAQAAITDVDAS